MITSTSIEFFTLYSVSIKYILQSEETQFSFKALKWQIAIAIRKFSSTGRTKRVKGMSLGIVVQLTLIGVIYILRTLFLFPNL